MKSINPATQKLIQNYPPISDSLIEKKIEETYQDWLTWKNISIDERAKMMFQLAEVLRENKQEYASMISQEMGKPISESLGEVEKSAWVCEFYAQQAEKMLQDEILESDAIKSFVSFEPLGVILAVMPWNFPFWQVYRFAAPALMAGNAGVLKHASNVMGCAQMIEDSFIKAGFPQHIFKNLQMTSSQVKKVIENPKITATTLTGSEWAGSKVAEASGKAIKKSVLELGGADAFIVLEDANLQEAAKWGVLSRMLNNGQSCIAAKRFILHKNIEEEFIQLVIEELKKWEIGDPMNKDTLLGPLARPDLLEDLDVQVKDAVEKGADLVFGGKAIEKEGNYYEPTLIRNITPDMKLYSEEAFGPVFSVFTIENEEEAIHLANNSEFGLGGSIWTGNTSRGVKIARQVESGAVFVNGMTKSDPRLPFGGIKKSGYGRELSHYGIKEFVNTKTIWVG